MVEQLFLESFGFGFVVWEFVTESFIVVLVGDTLAIDVFDVPGANNKDQSFFKLS